MLCYGILKQQWNVTIQPLSKVRRVEMDEFRFDFFASVLALCISLRIEAAWFDKQYSLIYVITVSLKNSKQSNDYFQKSMNPIFLIFLYSTRRRG